MPLNKIVIFLCPKCYPVFDSEVSGTYGGAEVQVYTLATEAAKQGCKVFVLVGDYGQPRRVEMHGVILVKAFYGSRLVQLYKFIHLLRKRSPDIVIQRSLTTYSGFLALVSRMLRARFVYMVAHDDEVRFSTRKPTEHLSWWMLQTMSTLMVVQNDFQKHHLPQAMQLSSTLPASPGATKKDGSILWVGRSVSWKNPEAYIELARSFPEQRFVMICPPATGKQEYWERLSKQARKNNITFIKQVHLQEIQKYYDRAKVFVNTSDQEGFPNTFLQAAAGGTPILSFRVNPNQILTDNNIGVVCRGDKKLLASELKALIKDENRRVAMGKNAKEYIRKYHHTPIIVKTILTEALA